jgi:hypothetical protein
MGKLDELDRMAEHCHLTAHELGRRKILKDKMDHF